MGGGYHYTLGNLSWRYSPTGKLLVVNHAAWMREKFTDSNPTNLPLGAGYYGEWVWNATVTWMWNARSPLDAGWSVRRLRDGGSSDQYQTNSPAPRLLDHYDGTAVHTGGYVQQSWMAWSGRLHLTPARVGTITPSMASRWYRPKPPRPST